MAVDDDEVRNAAKARFFAAPWELLPTAYSDHEETVARFAATSINALTLNQLLLDRSVLAGKASRFATALRASWPGPAPRMLLRSSATWLCGGMTVNTLSWFIRARGIYRILSCVKSQYQHITPRHSWVDLDAEQPCLGCIAPTENLTIR